MAHKIDSASGSITLISEDGSGNVNLTLPRAGLGTAASADTGTAAGNIPVLDGSGQIASGVLTNAAVADNAITLAKMAHGTDGELITYDATGAPANVAVGTSGQVLTSGGAGVAPTFQTSTHTPDDNSVTLAKMAHGTDGELITYDSSGAPATVGVGSSGQVLTSNGAGSAPTMQDSAGGGKVLQVVSVTKTDIFTTTSTSFVDITGFTASITPSATNSKILVTVHLAVGNASNSIAQIYTIVRDSTDIAIGDSAGSRTRCTLFERAGNYTYPASHSVTHLDAPSTTSPTVYKMKMKTNGGTGTINRNGYDPDTSVAGRTVSSITLMEIGA